MWPNVASGTTARCSGAGVVGGGTFAASVVAQPGTSTATRGTNVIGQRVQDAGCWPGFEGDIDFACMFSPTFRQGRSCPVGRRVLSAPAVPRGQARKSGGWPHGLLGARQAPTRGRAPGSGVETEGTPTAPPSRSALA